MEIFVLGNMKDSIKILIAIFLFSLNSCKNSSKSDETQLDTLTNIKVLGKTHNFGLIAANDSVNHVFRIVNTGNVPLSIFSAHASCGCTIPVWSTKPVPVGDTTIIKVTFKSRETDAGFIDKSIVFQSNTKSAFTVLHLKGLVE